MNLKTLLFFVLIPMALLLLSCGERGQIRKGSTIPDFRLVGLDGTEVDRQSLMGRPVVLNFWATWCGPCIKEIPALKEVARSNEAEVVAISLDEQGESVVRAFVERYGIEYTVLLKGSEVFEQFEGRFIPYTLVLDASLKIVSIHQSLVSRRTLERDLQRARSS